MRLVQRRPSSCDCVPAIQSPARPGTSPRLSVRQMRNTSLMPCEKPGCPSSCSQYEDSVSEVPQQDGVPLPQGLGSFAESNGRERVPLASAFLPRQMYPPATEIRCTCKDLPLRTDSCTATRSGLFKHFAEFR